uniref:Cytochrome P450 n=1 Tax=Heterorhabditis bacteriophora TaxID=37862 RepID=A0A1I7XLR8_HETBA
MSITLILVVAVAIYAIYSSRKQILDLWRLNRRCKWLLKDLPGPPSLPLIGSAHLFKWNNFRSLAYSRSGLAQYLLSSAVLMKLLEWVILIFIRIICSKSSFQPILDSNVNISKPNQYDIISEWIGTGLLTRYDKIKKTKFRKYGNHMRHFVLLQFFVGFLKFVLLKISPPKYITRRSTNDKWLRRRKMLTPAFHFNILQLYQEVFAKQGKILVNLLEKECGHYFDVFPYIKRCALDIICETAMGTEMNSQTGGSMEYVSAVQRVSAIIWNYERSAEL